ncbi:MAG TPA: Ig-like domain-containing protein [Candidatus Saccharimonadales bacterium]|nr:Ig-like domain-containing protein [Candidatus Saccharimonadales bacterium]
MAASFLVSLSFFAIGTARAQTSPLTTLLSNPTNNQTFSAPASIYVHARMADTNLIRTVQYFSGATSIGIVTNTPGVLVTSLTEGNPFPIIWSNVPAGAYSLTAVVVDNAGNTATTAPVNITVTNVPTPVVPYTVSFWYPTNGQTFAAPASIGIHASVTDSNVVSTVQYFANGSSIGTVTNSKGVLLTSPTQESPFYMSWNNVLAGNYALTVVATDSAGNTVTSAPVNITVTSVPPPVVPYTVRFLYPTNGQMFTAPATIGIYTLATDSNVVQTVQYFANGNSIGTVSNGAGVLLTNSTAKSPLYLTWSNVLAGNYALTAVATDSAGNTATSAPVNITVTNVPPHIVPYVVSFLYPTNGQTFAAPATIGVHATVTDSNVVSTVQYFANGNSIGTVTNSKGVLLTNSTTESPFYMTWSNVPAGNYALTAVATDSGGNMATSAPVKLIVTNVPAPIVPYTISFLSPANGQTFAGPAHIGVYVRVTDSNVVRTVQYFANGGSIGTATNSSTVPPTNTTQGSSFYISWSNVVAGNYALTAVATDSAGNLATSAPVNITVTNVPPHIIPYLVSFWYPTNGQTFAAPVTIGVHALVTDSNVVRTVQYFANGSSIGTVSNSGGVLLTNSTQDSPFFMAWSNVVAGNYALTAVATDSAGNTATSAPVNITVTNVPPHIIPYLVSFWYPTNGQTFAAPATIGVHALVTDSNMVRTVQYFANGSSIGTVSNSGGVLLTNSTQDSPFFMAWSNVVAGNYALTAVATDSAGNTATSAPVKIIVTNVPSAIVPYVVSFRYPTNGQTFVNPTAIVIYAGVTDSNVVRTVQYFANGNSIGTATNNGMLANPVQNAPFYILWSNVAGGSYALTAVATDSAGNTATSAPVNITVTNIPPPVVPYIVSFWYPTNGQTFGALATIGVHARITDSNVVRTVQYFANGNSIGTVSYTGSVLLTNSTQESPFYMAWSNVQAGTYSLIAVATDSAGNTATSAPVNLTVTNVPPPIVPYTVSFWYPTNGQTFTAPATIGVHARVTDSNIVRTVQYFANGNSIGTVSNGGGILLTNTTQENPFFIAWSNVQAGSYALTAVVIDSAGNAATSAPVNIYVVTNLPVVSIYAPDPVAVAGTNYSTWYSPTSMASNYVSGANTATFLVQRASGTNADLTVYYSISGTATNGVDYETIPSSVIIPAGKSYALITIIPLDDIDSDYSYDDTVVLSLIAPPGATNTPATYTLGLPQQAGAIILDADLLPIPQPVLRTMADGSLHASLPAFDGLNFTLQISTDLVTWLPVCTNTVLKGSAQFVDPNGSGGSARYYRIVTVSAPASY